MRRGIIDFTMSSTLGFATPRQRIRTPRHKGLATPEPEVVMLPGVPFPVAENRDGHTSQICSYKS